MYSNLEPDINIPSEVTAELRWYDIEVMRIVHATDRLENSHKLNVFNEVS